MNLKFITLIHKNKTRQSTTAEDQQLQDWKQENAAHQSYADDLSAVWEASADSVPSFQPDVEVGLSRLKTRIQAEESLQDSEGTTSNRNKSWLRIAAAALVLIVAGLVGSQIINSAEEMLVIHTADAETKIVELADGSIVTLNEKSTLTYPKSFDRDIRQVELNGEAFFDIERNPVQPFHIQTTHTQVTVLGTSFNVRSLANESTTEVNVSTGKVQLTSNKTKESIILIKDEEGVYNHRSQILNKVNHPSENALSWISHQLAFNKTPLTTVVRDLEHYFDVNISVQNEQLMQCSYTSLFNEPKIEDILELLTNAFDMELEQAQKDHYQLRGGQCN